MEQIDGKGTEQTIIRVDRIMHAVEGLLFRTSHMLALPSVNFNALMSKWSFAVYNLLLFLSQMAILTVIFGAWIGLQSYWGTRQFLNVVELVSLIVKNPLYQVIFFIMAFVHGRTVLFRMDDKEV
jgi:hypothetical protein